MRNHQVLDQRTGRYQWVASLLNVTGMRLFEYTQLRIKDMDLQ
jgi:integrase